MTTQIPTPRSRPALLVAALALCAALLSSVLVPAAAQGVPADWPDPTELTFEPIDFTAPEPTRATLSNGIVVYLAENRGLPLVSGVAYVEAPSVYEPDALVGLAGFTANLLREGGAGGRSPAEIDARLEFLAAGIEASANPYLSSVGFSALAENADEVMRLWRDVLTRPDFDAERIEIQRQRQLEAIRRVVDNPVQFAVREFQARVAAGHPSGRYATADTITAIARDDLIDFHARYYAPETTVLAVTGDFETDAMLALLEEIFGDWQATASAPPEVPPLPDPEPHVYLLPLETAQSVILVGHPAVTAYSDAYNDLDVANDILGAGGFSSRLFTEIRTRRGLAYSTGSQLGQGFERPGIFLAFSITRGDATVEALSVLLDEIRRLQSEPVGEAELEQARQRILNGAIFRDVSVAGVTERSARVPLLGLEPGYYARYLENVQAIDPEEIRAVAAAELHPDEAVILVAGDPSLFDGDLDTFGEVVVLEPDALR